MPEETADANSIDAVAQTVAADVSGSADGAVLLARISELEAQRDALQQQLDQQNNRSLERWLAVEQFESSIITAMQQTLSWRVTKPLRLVRAAQISRSPKR